MCDPRQGDIALVGIGCRFPAGIHDVPSFWEKLLAGVDVMTPVPPSRWDGDAVFDADPKAPGKTYVKHGGFVDNAFKFDPAFFNITPREAVHMDPQGRILLHTAYEALEDAGIPLETLRASETAVYVGVMNQDWAYRSHWEQLTASPYDAMGTDIGGLANRISYLLDLHGPSLTISTMCSSSMNSVHLACNSLLNGEADLALAGGVNLMLVPDITIGSSKAGLLSKSSGPSRSFDENADGYMRSEGSALVVLKRLQDAIRDNDHVYAVIRSSASNHDGSKEGLTKPNGKAHQFLMKTALKKANLTPNYVHFVEAHGTGTAVGDPIEVKAIGTVFGGKQRSQLVVGSVKANIGHTEASSGVAGIIKLALALKNRTIPRNIHFDNPNPKIPFEELNLRIPVSNEPWPQNIDGQPRVGALNSFGATGSNGAAILEEYIPPAKRPTPPSQPFLLPISAHSQPSLVALAKHYLAFFERMLEGKEGADLADVVYTAAVRRSHFYYRLALVGNTVAQFIALLKEYLDNPTTPNSQILSDTHPERIPRPKPVTGKQKPKKHADAHASPAHAHAHADAHATPALAHDGSQVVFVFCGMGSQWHTMGRQLAAAEPVFLRTLQRIDEHLRALGGVPLLDELLHSEEGTQRIDEAVYAQPGIFAVQVGLVELWKSWGVLPCAVLGHSFGEVAAAYAAGAFTLEQATSIVFHRSRLLQKMRGSGTMLAASVGEERAKKLADESGGAVVVAAFNSAKSVTFAGQKEKLESIAAQLKEEGVFARMLNVDIPYHSPVLGAIEQEYIQAISSILQTTGALHTPLFSTVTGQRVLASSDLHPQHWVHNMMHSVYFQKAIQSVLDLLKPSGGVLVEVGPHPVLSVNIKEIIASSSSSLEGQHVRLGFSIRRKEHERTGLLQNLGSLYAHRQSTIAWSSVVPQGNCVRIPGYRNTEGTWQYDDYEEMGKDSLYWPHVYMSSKAHPTLGVRLDSAVPAVWKFDLKGEEVEYMTDHRTLAGVLVPGAAYMDMMYSAALEVAGKKSDDLGAGGFNVAIQDLLFAEAIFIPGKESASVPIQTTYNSQTNDTSITSFSTVEKEWKNNVKATLNFQNVPYTPVHDWKLEQFKKECTDPILKTAVYWKMNLVGLKYGKCFQLVDQAWAGDNQSVSKIFATKLLLDTDPKYGDHVFHPAVFDACLHSSFLALSLRDVLVSHTGGGLYLPVGLAQAVLVRRPPTLGALWVCARKCASSGGETSSFSADLQVFDDEGNLCLEIIELRCKSLRSMDSDLSAWTHGYEWLKMDDKPVVAAQSTKKAWLLFADPALPIVQHVLDNAVAGNVDVIVVEKGPQFGKTKTGYRVRGRQDFTELLQVLIKEGELSKVTDAIWMWNFRRGDASAAKEEGEDEVCGGRDVQDGFMGIAVLMQEHEKVRSGYLRAWHISAHGQRVNDADIAGSSDYLHICQQGALWSFVRSAMQLRVWRWRQVDLAYDPSQADGAVLFRHLDGADAVEEDEVAIRDGNKYANRLVRIPFAEPPRSHSEFREDAPWNLEYRKGDKPTLTWRDKSEPYTKPNHAQVVIDSISFVNSNHLAFVGRIRALDGAEAHAGDTVVGITLEPKLSSVSTIPLSNLVKWPTTSPIPAGVVGSVIPYVVAFYVLETLGNIQHNDRVLLLNLSFDFISAFIQVCRSKNAKAVVVVQSEDHVAAIPTSEHVEIVHANKLNFTKLAAAFELVIDANFQNTAHQAVAEFGKIINLSTGIAHHTPQYSPSMNYSIQNVVLDRILSSKNTPSILARVVSLLDSKSLPPLRHTLFTPRQSAAATSWASEKTGAYPKAPVVVIDTSSTLTDKRESNVKTDGTYLITGGLSGGIGFGIASWMITHYGVKHVILLGRRTAPSREVTEEIEKLTRMYGVNIQITSCDVSDYKALKAVVDAIPPATPLRGIVHAASGLAFIGVMRETEETVASSVLSKVQGAYNLHRLSLSIPTLTMFVATSSVASIGERTSAGYSGANGALISIMEYRQRVGLPGFAAAFGPMYNAGLLSDNMNYAYNLEYLGFYSCHTHCAFKLLFMAVDWHLHKPGVPAQGAMIIAPIEPDTSMKTMPSSIFLNLLTKRDAEAAEDGAPAKKINIPSLLEGVTDNDARKQLVVKLVVNEVAKVTGTSPNNIDPSVSLLDVGLDSLVMVELRTKLLDIGMQVVLGTLMEGPSIVDLVAKTIV